MIRQNSTAKKERFLKAFAKCGNISHAAEVTGVDRTSHYVWLKDEAYKTAFENAKEQAVEVLEMEARRRSVLGIEKRKFHNGEPITYIDENGNRVPYIERLYSDLLLIFLLKANNPEKYRERHEVKHAGNVDVTHGGHVRIIEDSDWYGNFDRLKAIQASN